MHVTHAYSGISASGGGIVAVLAALLPALRAQNVDVDLVALEAPGEARAQSPLDGPHLHLARPRDRFGFGYAPELKNLMESVAQNSDVIHSHALWVYMSHVADRVAKTRKLPHIISVHGMMEPYIQERSRFKKAPIEWWFQTRALRDAAVIQALSMQEVEDVRRLGFKNPIALVPNGVDLASVSNLPPREVFETRFPAVKDRQILLFMARLHPKKGLLHFLPAWKRVAANRNWHLVIAGPDEGGHRAQLEALVAQLNIENVSFTGLLRGEAKREALGAADAFVLPSLSEGFSMSLLEALGANLPLLMTSNCNFPAATRAGAAISSQANTEGAAQGLEELFALSSSKRQQMGRAGRHLVEENYTWDAVAKSLREVYSWCAEKGEKPACIVD